MALFDNTGANIASMGTGGVMSPQEAKNLTSQQRRNLRLQYFQALMNETPQATLAANYQTQQQNNMLLEQQKRKKEAMDRLKANPGTPPSQADLMTILGADKYLTATMGKTPKNPTSYDEYLRTDPTPTSEEYTDFLKNKGRGTNITVNTGDGTEGFSGGVSKTYSTAMEGSDAAFNTMGILDNMNSILDTGIRTGGGQEALVGMKQWIQTVDSGLVDSDALANAENFQSASLLYLTPKVKQLGTNPTDADLKLFTTALPTLGKSVAGNRLILDTLKLSEQRKINEAEFVENWLYKNAELVKKDAFTANLDLNKELRAYRKSAEYRMPAEALKDRRKEILRQQKLIDEGKLTAITLDKNPWD